MDKKAFIIQARAGSRRLPQKMLLPFYNQKTLVEIQVDLLRSVFDYTIILATSDQPQDDQIAKIGDLLNIHVYRGSESDVLHRFIEAATYYNVEHICRVCGDNPFLSGDLLLNLFSFYDRTEFNYVSYKWPDKTPAMLSHLGIFTEVFNLDFIKKIYAKTNDSKYREHVTNYIYTNPESFNHSFVDIPTRFLPYRHMRLTIDTKEDFDLVSRLYNSFRDSGLELSVFLKEVLNDSKAMETMTQQIQENEK